MALQLQPKPTFRIAVTFIDADGSPLGSANFEFRHKTREGLKEFWQSVGTAKGPHDDFEALSMLTVSTDAFDGDVTPKAFAEFCEPLPSAAAQLIAAYHDALTDGRRKN